MTYFGSKISPNLTKTDEGILIALNVPIARTGVQKYLPSEVPLDDPEQYAGPDGLIDVYRDPGEVFSPPTVASFEGKPVADGHPSTPDNKIHVEDIGLLGRGHMQNVRRGAGDEVNDLVADLFITDPMLSDQVERNEKREVSCGYDCDFVPENGKVYQRKIIGNHVAIVPRGRAGSSVAIKDEEPKIERRIHVAKDNLFKRALGMGLKEAIKDADPEDVAELMKEHDDKPKEEPVKDAAPEGEGALTEILTAIKGIETRLTALEQSDKKVHAEVPKDAMDALETETKEEEGPEDPEEESEKSDTIDCIGFESGKHPAGDSDAAVKDFVRQLKPSIAKISDKATRDSLAQACLDALHGGTPAPKGSVYGGISKAVQTNKAKAARDADTTRPQTVAEKNAAFVANLKKIADAEK